MTPATHPKMFAVLAHRDFRRLALARFVSFLGNGVAPIALAFAVLDISHSATAVGAVLGARTIASLVTVLWGGVLADRLPRGTLLSASSFFSGVVQAVAAVLILTSLATVPLLTLLAVLGGASSSLAMPASGALVQQTVPRPHLQSANAALRLLTNLALVAGAALGGMLIAAVGPGWGTAVDAASFVVAAGLFTLIRVPAARTQTATRRTPLRDLRDGWAEFISHTWVWAIVLEALVWQMAWAASMQVLGPVIADTTLGRANWGFVLAAQTAGLVLGGIVALRWRPRRALLVGVLLSAVPGVMPIALGIWPNVLLLVPLALVAGLCLEQFGVAWEVSLQSNIDEDRLARVYAFDFLGSIVAAPIGLIVVGPLADLTGVSTLLVIIGLLIMTSALATACLASVRRLVNDTAASSAHGAPADTDEGRGT
jgi:MFS family permease